MCQWGSSRWANRGFTWKWINEHYYSPRGYRISTPMRIVSVSATPTNVCIGDTFRIDLNVQSYAEDTHNRISDPPRDIKVFRRSTQYLGGDLRFSRCIMV
jgi:hypothetical protein